MDLLLQRWAGSEVKYWCNDESELIQRSKTQGSKYAVSVCTEFSDFNPWWSLNSIGNCTKNLQEIPFNVSGNYLICIKVISDC